MTNKWLEFLRFISSPGLGFASRRLLSNDATETDMARRGVHRLCMTRSRAVAAAVIWRTQVRATFQHLTRDLDFGLAWIVARLLATAREIDRDAAGLVGIAVVSGGKHGARAQVRDARLPLDLVAADERVSRVS